MRVLVHAYFPVRRDVEAGGVQRVAGAVLPRLAAQGVEITVLCPQGSDPYAIPGVTIMPVLEHRDGGSFSAAGWKREAARAAAAARHADVAWSFDRPLPGRVGIPRLMTIGTLTYSSPLGALLTADWDALAVPSAFLAGVAGAVAGPALWDGDPPPIVHIPNGLDLDALRPVDPGALRGRLGLRDDARCLLFPHRPEPGKGLGVALAALARLVAADPRFRLLVPREPDSLWAYAYDDLLREARGAGLAEHVVLHPWIAPPDLAAYLSLGACSLTLSSLPEGFGFGPVEAVACGTPAVSTGSGALGELLPDGHGVTYVARDDPDAVAAAVLDPPGAEKLARGRAATARRYGIDAAVAAYRDLLAGIRPRRASYAPLGANAARA